MNKIVIIGNSMSAFASCQAFINSGRLTDFNITVFSEEKYLPYKRNLLIDYLSGIVKESDLFLCAEDFYANHKIDLQREREVCRLDTRKKRVILKNNDKMEYDYLIIASGRKPFISDIPGKQKDGVLMFYSLGDLNAIKQKIDIVSCVNIVGDGTESLRLAEFFLARDKEVKIIGKNKPDSFIATDKLEWIEGLKPLELIGEGSELKAMKLDNGKVIAASIVLFATNFRPSSSFLKDTDINLEEGYVIIDENMQTNLENIFACGSVCRRSGFLEEKTPDTYNQEGIKIAESIMHYARGEKICQRF